MHDEYFLLKPCSCKWPRNHTESHGINRQFQLVFIIDTVFTAKITKKLIIKNN